jgi:hypothetical protein
MLHSIELFLARSEPMNDKRILMQLEDVQAGIQQVITAVTAARERA